MNILYYLDSFPKLSKSFVLNELYELDKNGHNVAVCALGNPNENIVHKEFNDLNIPIFYTEPTTHSDIVDLISPTILRPRVLKDAFYPASVNRHGLNLHRAKQCIEFIETLDWTPTHVHSHFASRSTFGARYVANYYNVPVTVTTHAYDLYEEPVGEYTRTLLDKVDRIITISNYNREYMQSQFAVDTPIDIVRAGIRPEKFSPTNTSAPNRVLTISRFIEKKGLPYALEAIEIAAEEIPDIEHHIIGSGKQKAELQSVTEELGLTDTGKFLDNVTDERLLTELDEASCFLLPSVIADSGDRDGIPVVLMEAMAMKTPPVSTTVSGIPELIDHERNGLLCEPKNASAIADAITELLQNESKRADYSEQAREKVVEEFNITTEVQKLEAIFEKTEVQ